MKDKEQVINRLKYNVVLLLFPIVSMVLLGPLEIFSSNQDEFLFGVRDFIWIFLLLGLSALLLGGIFLSLIPKKLSALLTNIIFATSLMAYIQNMFLNGKLMNLDGSKMDWEGLTAYSRINLIIWCIVILTLIIIAKIIKDKCKVVFFYVSLFLSAIQVVAVLSLVFSSRYGDSLDTRYALTAQGQYTLGNQSNVIVLILDKYGNGAFNDRLAQDAHFADVLQDFTYYDNMNSTYAYTCPSLTYIFTQYKRENSVRDDEQYLNEAWQSQTSKDIFARINEAGYGRYLYTVDSGHVYKNAQCLDGLFDNNQQVECRVDSGLLFRLLTKMSIYKYVPTIIKRDFEVSTNSFTGVITYVDNSQPDYDNSEYYASLCEQGLSIDESVGQKLVITHIEGTHNPYSFAADGSRCPESTDEQGLIETQKGLMLVIDTYLSQLKELGLYDSSTVIIMSDHGFKFDEYDPQSIFFIKPAGQNLESMEINHAPVSSEDIVPTILCSIGVKYDDYGKSVFEWNEQDQRQRSCSYPENNFEPYIYNGDRSELIELMKNN